MMTLQNQPIPAPRRPTLADAPASLLGERFEDALRYAAQLHAGQLRKGTRIPYVSHLLSVAALVLDHGGDEDQAIAALLHDAVEDQGGLERLRAIRGRYGDRVAAIVLACSDSWTEPKPPWRERKEQYLTRLRQEPPALLLVSVADKLHNARAILADLRDADDGGAALFARFNGGREGTLWYYQALVQAYRETGVPHRLVAELEQVVAELASRAGDAGDRERANGGATP